MENLTLEQIDAMVKKVELEKDRLNHQIFDLNNTEKYYLECEEKIKYIKTTMADIEYLKQSKNLMSDKITNIKNSIEEEYKAMNK